MAIACPPRPRAVNLALLSLPDFAAVVNTFKQSKGELSIVIYSIYILYPGQLGEILSSCEFIDAGSMDCVTGNLGLKCPLAENNFYMLIETSGSNAEHGDNQYFFNPKYFLLLSRRGQADPVPGEHDD